MIIRAIWEWDRASGYDNYLKTSPSSRFAAAEHLRLGIIRCNRICLRAAIVLIVETVCYTLTDPSMA